MWYIGYKKAKPCTSATLHICTSCLHTGQTILDLDIARKIVFINVAALAPFAYFLCYGYMNAIFFALN